MTDKLHNKVIEILENLIKGVLFGNERMVPIQHIEKATKKMREIAADRILKELKQEYKEEVKKMIDEMSYTGVLNSNEKRRGYDIARQELKSELKNL